MFISFKKAFNSIHREKILKVLRAYRIQKLIVAAIKHLCTDSKAKVLSHNIETEFFEIIAGVL